MGEKVTYISNFSRMKPVNDRCSYGGKGNVYFKYNNKSDKTRKLTMKNTNLIKTLGGHMLRKCREFLIHLRYRGNISSCKRSKEQSHI